MKYLNKLATVLCSAALGLLAMTSCEGGDLYEVGSPDWIQSKVDSIEANKPQGEVELPDGEEDVYTIGKTDFSSGWWADFSKYYVIPNKQKWDAVFTLNINPAASNTYKNFALILTNDVDRGGDGYIEYGAIRYDNQPSGNSEWGDYIDRSCVESTLTFGTDTDPGVEKLGGRVILSIDRTDANAFTVTMDNGVVKKTYKQKSALPNLNNDPGNENIRAFLVVEGSYISFMQSNIEPIGGFTSAEDKKPLTMQVSGIPDEVLVGMSLDKIKENFSATVTFEQGVVKQVNGTELYATVVDGDFETVGEKTIAIIYNKTFKGQLCGEPAVAMAKINVVNELSSFTSKYVCPDPVILGATDNSTGFWGAHTANIKVEPRQTAIVSFTNYTPGTENWNNFVTVLCNADGSQEYAVVRADNYGWGDGYAACKPETTVPDWETWRAAMNGAKVTEYITNNGDGTATIKAVMHGTDGVEYVQTYTGINKVNKDEMYFNFTVDGCHLVFDTVVGELDNSTPWWSAFSQNIQIPAHTVFTTSFTNYTSGANNWNNFCVVLNAADVAKEYAVVRADNYGWGDGYAACTHDMVPMPMNDDDWATWRAALNGAKVDLTIINNGNGLVDVKEVFHGTNGVDYTQTYTGINAVDPSNLYFRLVMDGSHVEFSPAVTQAKRNAILLGKRRR